MSINIVSIDRENRTRAEGRRRHQRLLGKILGPLSAIFTLKRELESLAAQQATYRDNPPLTDAAAGLIYHRFNVALFAMSLLILLCGELLFVMPALIGAIGAVSGGLLNSKAFTWLGGVLLLAVLSSTIIVLKRFLPPLSSCLSDAIDITVENPSDRDELAAAYQRRRVARRNTLLSLSVMAIYLTLIGWVMSHNLSAGRIFLEHIEIIRGAGKESRTATPTTLGDSLFGTNPGIASPTGEASSTPGKASRTKNPQSAVLGLFLILHAVLLLIPIDWKTAARQRQELAAWGLSRAPAALQARREKLDRHIIKKARSAQGILASASDPESGERLKEASLLLVNELAKLTADTRAVSHWINEESHLDS
ncbi:MAG: hypothetical protein ABL994_06445 [Verrucomicrobiales bacterium]